jgi:hypothetical protein
LRDYGEPRHVKIIFSERGGTLYSHTKAYQELIKMQSESGTLILTKRTIKWRVIDSRLLDVIPHNQNPGLQLADVVASSFYQAADTLKPTIWNPEHAKRLKPVMATEGGFHIDYGVTLQPTPPWRAELTHDQKKIFEFYKYDFRP